MGLMLAEPGFHTRCFVEWEEYPRSVLIAAQRAGYLTPAPIWDDLTTFDARPLAGAIDKLLAADCEPHIRLAILLMLTTAGRVGAILDLTWNRVDLDRGIIRLRNDIEGPRKGRATVPINATLRAALTFAKQAALTDYVVEWAGGRVQSIRKGFASAVANAGLKNVTPHVLRHTAAVHMAEAGVPMEVISQYLGHSNAQITRAVYARFSPDFMADAAAALDFGTVRKVK